MCGLEEDTHEDLARVLKVLLPHLDRWRVLRCTGPLVVGVAIALAGRSAPLLEEVQLVSVHGELGTDGSYPFRVVPLFAGPSSVPRLSRVTLCCQPTRFDSHCFSALQVLNLQRLPQGRSIIELA